MLPSSRREQIRQSLSDFGRSSSMIFESKKDSWPEPEKSIGRPCAQRLRVTECWEVVGPALELMQKLSPDIKRLLEENRELLEQGEDRPRVVAFNMWMEGSKPTSAQPIIVFSSKSRRQRSFAKALLKQSGLLADHPSIQIKTLDKMPAVYRAAEGESTGKTMTKDDKDVYVVGRSTDTCGTLISFGNSKISTLTATFIVGDVWYGVSAQHTRLNYPQEPASPTSTVEFLTFDEDSDEEVDDVATATSKASVSTSSPAGVDTTAFQSSEDDSVFDGPRRTSGFLPTEPSTLTLTGIELKHADPVSIKRAPMEEPLQRTRIGRLLDGRGLTDLDYELFLLESTTYKYPSRIRIPADKGDSSDFLYPSRVATEVAEGPVLVATGPTGTVKGVIMKNAHYIRMDRSMTYQEMWPVQLDRYTMPGDSGSLVVDATTGDIYGHIVSGDPTSSLAYIIPAYKIFNDIEKQFGARPSFSSAVQQRSNSTSREQHVQSDKDAKKMFLSQIPRAIQQRRNATYREERNTSGKQAEKMSFSLIPRVYSANQVSLKQNSRAVDSRFETSTDLPIDHAIDDAVKHTGYAMEHLIFETEGRLRGLSETTLKERYQQNKSDQHISSFLLPEDPGAKRKAESISQEDMRKTRTNSLKIPLFPRPILNLDHHSEAALPRRRNSLHAPLVPPPRIMTPQMMPPPPLPPQHALHITPNAPPPPPQNYSYDITRGYPTQPYPHHQLPSAPIAPQSPNDPSSDLSNAYARKDKRSERPSANVHRRRGVSGSDTSDSSLETDIESVFSSNSDYRDSISHYSVATDQSSHSRHTAVDSKDDPRRLTDKEKRVVIHRRDSSPSYQEHHRRLPDRRRPFVEFDKEVVIIPARSTRRKDSPERGLAYRPGDRPSSIRRRLSFSEDPRFPPPPTSKHRRRDLSDYPLVLRDEIERQRVEKYRLQRFERDQRVREQVKIDRLQRQHLERRERHSVGRITQDAVIIENERARNDQYLQDRELEDRQAQRKDGEEIYRVRAEEYEGDVRRRAEREPGLARRDTYNPSTLRQFSGEETRRRWL